ncbi:MAG: hypothetical protein JNJ40_00990 [Bacteroidia bacterium]|nr:hypothetical protein [Bacteroidia bacterium]
MKNVIAYFILAFIFVSCNIKNEEAVKVPVVAVPEDSLNTDTGIVPVKDTVSLEQGLRKAVKLLLIARGSEPGWYAEFFEDHLRLLIDNGTDSLKFEKDFSDINEGNSYDMNLKQDFKNPGDKIVKVTAIDIKVENKSCTEEGSGEKREKSISIKYNGKTYKGCATAKIN